MRNTQNSQSASLWRPALVAGFGVSVGLWCVWFVTHLPSLARTESTSLPILLAYWLLGALIVGRCQSGHAGWKTGLFAGLVTALVGLLALGSKLSTDGATSELKPNAPLIAAGFVALGAIIGVVGGVLGGMMRPKDSVTPDNATWNYRFAIVTVCAIFPLLLVGGLVTSANAGMAVPDWPNTYGSNMFLYPLGPRAQAAMGADYSKVFLEHSHRLFGTLAGMSALTLMCMTIAGRHGAWIRNWSIGLFLMVALQGTLGGLRVIYGDAVDPSQNRWIAALHGVFAQVVFAVAVSLAVYLSRTYREGSQPYEGSRRLRAFATAAWHSTFVQLGFGAMYRHLRSPHALWSHAGFAFIVLAMATIASFAAARTPADTPFGRVTRRAAGLVRLIVAFQFVLGWVAFMVAGKGVTPDTAVQSLIRTAHQANGALLVAAVTCLALLARRIPK